MAICTSFNTDCEFGNSKVLSSSFPRFISEYAEEIVWLDRARSSYVKDDEDRAVVLARVEEDFLPQSMSSSLS